MRGTPADEPFPRVKPLEPAEALKSFRCQHGFEMQLLAAEPLVTDPVAMDYDEHGRAFVCEMSDYPYTDKTTDKPFVERTMDLPFGRVRMLEDLDGDGRFDRSTLFAEGLSWPTGLAFWDGGVYVAATPDIWFRPVNFVNAPNATLTGVFTNETAGSVTLRRPQGQEDVMLRSQIEEVTSSGESLMPEGVEKKVTPQDLADLLAHLLKR